MIRLALTLIALMQFGNTRDAIPYFIDDGAGVPGYRQGDSELARMALAAWTRESGGKLRFVAAKSKDDALLRDPMDLQSRRTVWRNAASHRERTHWRGRQRNAGSLATGRSAIEPSGRRCSSARNDRLSHRAFTNLDTPLV